jgi:hypothetical protein
MSIPWFAGGEGMKVNVRAGGAHILAEQQQLTTFWL